jgi:hypothetical protein
MSDEAVELPDLETSSANLYRGPLEEFVRRRDALVKELRAIGRRDEAETIRTLRKPSRAAWTLDNAVLADSTAIERLAHAVRAAMETQSNGSGDLRAAFESVRSAVREFAEAAAQAAGQAGHQTDAPGIVPAVLAVMGDNDAFAALLAGRLVEIPEGGALDFLNAVPAARQPAEPEVPTQDVQDTDDAAAAATAAATAQAELDRAEASLAEARERAQSAQQALRDAEARLAAADQDLKRAWDEAAARRSDLERARQDAATSTATVQDAEEAVEDARARTRQR